MFNFFQKEGGFQRVAIGNHIFAIENKQQIEDVLYKAYTNKFDLAESIRKDLIKELKARLEKFNV